jgi:hypothetical protein
MMRHDEYLRDGLPIGTGAIEGACRNLIDRGGIEARLGWLWQHALQTTVMWTWTPSVRD